jgi:hypothetical protein
MQRIQPRIRPDGTDGKGEFFIQSYPWLKIFALALFGAAATSKAVDYHVANARQLENAHTLTASDALVPGFTFKLAATLATVWLTQSRLTGNTETFLSVRLRKALWRDKQTGNWKQTNSLCKSLWFNPECFRGNL